MRDLTPDETLIYNQRVSLEGQINATEEHLEWLENELSDLRLKCRHTHPDCGDCRICGLWANYIQETM